VVSTYSRSHTDLFHSSPARSSRAYINSSSCIPPRHPKTFNINSFSPTSNYATSTFPPHQETMPLKFPCRTKISYYKYRKTHREGKSIPFDARLVMWQCRKCNNLNWDSEKQKCLEKVQCCASIKSVLVGVEASMDRRLEARHV
jgi:hypothetical protein